MAKNLIGNQWLDSSSGEVIRIINPATAELIDTVPESTKEDCDLAVSAALKAQKDWEAKPLYERASILMKFVHLVEENKEELANLLSCETGKPITEAIAEVANVSVGVPAFCEMAKHEYGNLIPNGQEKGNENTIQYTVQAPLGVVVAIIPFNFPSDLFCQKVPSALLMGNSVILKPSPHNPLTLIRYVELLLQAGVPAGVINVINGTGGLAAQALAANPSVSLVSLTGATSSGVETMKTCSNNLTHVMLELGGNDAFILDQDGDIDLAVEETIWGRFYNTGQVCCASKRFLVHNDIKEEFTRRVIEKISTMRIGNPMDESTEIGCLINERAARRVEEQVNTTIAQGAKLMFGGRRNGAYYEPAVLTNVTRDMDIMKDMEVFGPVIPICGFDTIEEAIDIANQSSFGLCGNIITKDINNAFKVAEKLEVGGAVINGASFFRSAEMPFGGWKHSGIGNEGIATTLQEMSRIKTIVLKNVLK